MSQHQALLLYACDAIGGVLFATAFFVTIGWITRVERRAARAQLAVNRLADALSLHVELDHGRGQDAADLLNALADIVGSNRE